MNVAFDYQPLVEDVEGLMDELIRDLYLNPLRKDEIVQIFKMKADEEINGHRRIIPNEDKDKLDEIEMTFDYPNHLSFKLNGKEYKNIEINSDMSDSGVSYRMGIAFNGQPHAIELFDYEQLRA